MKLKILVSLLVFMSIGVSAQQVEAQEVQTQDIEQAVEVYNSNTDRVPSFMSSLIGDQTINVHIDNKTFGIEMDGKEISRAEKSALEDPTLEVYASTEEVESIASSEEPVKQLNQRLKNGSIEYETKGTVNSAKFFIFEKILSFGSLF